MQRDFTAASSLVHALTVLACCLYVVQSVTGAENASEHQSLVVVVQPTHHADVNVSAEPSVSPAEAQRANITSAAAVSEPVNNNTQCTSSTEASSTLCTCEQTVTPPWLLTQQDWCPASQGTVFANDTGTSFGTVLHAGVHNQVIAHPSHHHLAEFVVIHRHVVTPSPAHSQCHSAFRQLFQRSDHHHHPMHLYCVSSWCLPSMHSRLTVTQIPKHLPCKLVPRTDCIDPFCTQQHAAQA